jgi:hypothetical protein
VYSIIKNGVCISEKFIGLAIKPTSKSISALLKLELTKMNLLSVKIPRKRKEKGKIPCFLTHAFLAPCVNPQHANILFHKPFILINFHIHTVTFFAPIVNNTN